MFCFVSLDVMWLKANWVVFCSHAHDSAMSGPENELLECLRLTNCVSVNVIVVSACAGIIPGVYRRVCRNGATQAMSILNVYSRLTGKSTPTCTNSIPSYCL